MNEKETKLSRRDFLVKGTQMAGGLMMLSSMGGILAACAKVGTSNGKVTDLVFQTWTSEAKEVIDAQVAQFKKAFPDLNVTVQYFPYDDYWKKLPISIAGGTGPDLFVMTRPNFETFARAKQAADITQEVKNSAKLQQNLAKMNSVFVQTYQYKGQTRGVPFGVDSTGIVFNKTLIQKEGLKLPSEIEKSWSWNDLRDIAIKLTKRSGNDITQYGYLVPVNRLPTFEYLWSNGAELFNPAGDQCTIASKEGIQAMQFLTDLAVKDKVSPTPAFIKDQSVDDLFMTGKIAMMNVGNYTMPKYRAIKDFEWDVAEIPFSPNTNKRFVSSNVLGYIVGPNTKAKAEIIQLLEQLTSKESQQVYAEKGVYIPTYGEAQDPFFSSDKPANLKAFQRCLSYAKPMVFSEWVSYPEVQRVIKDALDQMYSGKVSVEQGWKAAENELNKIIQENKAKG